MTDNRSGRTGTPATEPAEAPLHTEAGEDATGGAGQQQQQNPPTADMQAFIGRQLRAVYDDVAKQPVPDRFIELMKQLDSKKAEG